MLTCCWLGERITPFEVVTMLFVVVGIVLLFRKDEDENLMEVPVDPTVYKPTPGFYELGIILAMAGCITNSFLSVSSRRMKEVNFAVLQFNQALVSSIITGIGLIVISIKMNTIPFNYPTGRTYRELFFSGFVNFVGQSLQVIAN